MTTKTPAAAPKNTTKAPKAGKPETNGHAKKEGLRAPQVRILAALKKSGKAMTRNQLSEKAPVDLAMCTEYIGSTDADKRKANDAKHFPSLISLGYVKFGNGEDAGGTVVEITKSGIKALEKA